MNKLSQELDMKKLSIQAKKIIDTARKSLKEDKKNNKLGDTTGFFSEEEKKELIENAKLAQLNWKSWS